MALRDTIVQTIAKFYFERPARKKSFDELTQALESSAQTIETRISSADETSQRNHKQLGHIIGIERWGQQRLRGFLGEAPILTEEYDGYRPDEEMSWSDLHASFTSTRQETLGLARQLEAEAVTADATVHHNDFGDVSARGWLRYLETHARVEAKRLK